MDYLISDRNVSSLHSDELSGVGGFKCLDPDKNFTELCSLFDKGVLICVSDGGLSLSVALCSTEHM